MMIPNGRKMFVYETDHFSVSLALADIKLVPVVVIFPGKYVYFLDGGKYWEIPGNMGNTGKYQEIQNFK